MKMRIIVVGIIFASILQLQHINAAAVEGAAGRDDANALLKNVTTNVTHNSVQIAATAAPAINWRLPNTSYPLSYDVHISTHLHLAEYAEYSGNCSILLHVLCDTTELYMHAKNLSITTATIGEFVDGAYAGTRAGADVAYVNATEMLVLSYNASAKETNFNKFLANHSYRIDFIYAGVITAHNIGFHVITETDTDNSTVIGAMTLFEPTHARSFMPCYDEPGYKANFTLHVTHGVNYTVISNMPQHLQTREHEESMVTTHFMTTPPMPVYLLALVMFRIGTYVNYTANARFDNQTLPQRVFIPKLLSERPVTTTVTIAPLALKALSNYFDFVYGLPKLDHIAVSKMYGTGMENWGLITYKYQILVDEEQFMPHWRVFILSMTLTHELVHQWIGNLVTPQWWDQLWLSEGLGTYLSYIIMDIIRPELDNIYLLECPRSYMDQSDQNPIVKSVESIKEIEASFDTSVYRRAPCMLHMLHDALGDAIFHNGLKLYIKRHAYAAVTDKQLYEALQTVAIERYAAQNLTWDYDIGAIFQSWTHSSSYPMLIVTRDYEQNVLYMKQMAYNATARQHYWWIPLRISTAELPESEVIYMPPAPEWRIDLNEFNLSASADEWLIVGLQNKEIYKVIYDVENMRRLATALLNGFKHIGQRERAALLCHQAQNLRFYNNEQVLVLFELLGYLEYEEDIYVWTTAAKTLGELVVLFDGHRAVGQVRAYFQKLAQPIMSKYGTKHKEQIQNLTVLEADLIYSLEFHLGCFIQMTACLERAAARFDKGYEKLDMENENIACVVGKNITDHQFGALLEMHFKENLTNTVDAAVLHILKCTPHASQYEKLLLQVINAQGCAQIFARLNILFNKIEFIKIHQALELLDKHINHISHVMGDSCTEYEQFLRHLRPYCHKAESYELTNVTALCLQQQTLGWSMESAYASMEYYDALDEQIYNWLKQRLTLSEP